METLAFRLITVLFLSLDSMNNVMIKQDPVMVANHKDEPLDPEDFILQDSMPLFDNRYPTQIEWLTFYIML